MPTPTTPQTIGDLLTGLTTTKATADASQAAAVQADAQATSDAAAFVAEQALVATAIAAVGPITIANNDGTYTTFDTSSTAPGYHTESSKGVGTLLPVPPVDPPAPATS